jgi:hypothetical protein
VGWGEGEGWCRVRGEGRREWTSIISNCWPAGGGSARASRSHQTNDIRTASHLPQSPKQDPTP